MQILCFYGGRERKRFEGQHSSRNPLIPVNSLARSLSIRIRKVEGIAIPPNACSTEPWVTILLVLAIASLVT